jgi:hypothetical protein
MKTCVRLPHGLFTQMTEDFARPHPFAYERVGFLYARHASGTNVHLVLATEYVALPNDQYVCDSSVGARISSDAIFEACNRTKRTGMCCLHAHAHGTAPGTTWFSRIDLNTLGRLGPTLRRMSPLASHGGIVLTGTTASALIWTPGDEGGRRARVGIIGFPTRLDGDDDEHE